MKVVWVFCGNEKNRSGGKAQEVGMFSAKKLQKTIGDGTIRIFLESELLAMRESYDKPRPSVPSNIGKQFMFRNSSSN